MPLGHDRRLREIEELYRARFPYFVQVARAIVGDRERALEAVQEGFVGVVVELSDSWFLGAVPSNEISTARRHARVVGVTRTGRIVQQPAFFYKRM